MAKVMALLTTAIKSLSKEEREKLAESAGTRNVKLKSFRCQSYKVEILLPIKADAQIGMVEYCQNVSNDWWFGKACQIAESGNERAAKAWLATTQILNSGEFSITSSVFARGLSFASRQWLQREHGLATTNDADADDGIL